MKGPALFSFSKLSSLVSLIKKKEQQQKVPQNTKSSGKEKMSVSDSAEKHADVLFLLLVVFVGTDDLLMEAKALSNLVPPHWN